MPAPFDLLRRIADSPAGLIEPRSEGRPPDGPEEDLIATLERLYAQGLISHVRVIPTRANPRGPVAFSARLTASGRASLAAFQGRGGD